MRVHSLTHPLPKPAHMVTARGELSGGRCLLHMLSQLMQCVVVQSKAVFQEGSHWHVPSLMVKLI